jgi:hypothetical protein
LRPVTLPAHEEIHRTFRRWVRQQTDLVAATPEFLDQTIDDAFDAAIEFGRHWNFRIDCKKNPHA